MLMTNLFMNLDSFLGFRNESFWRVSFILILYVIFLIWPNGVQTLDITALNTKKLALFYLVMYVLSIEQKTYTGKGASSGLSCRKDYSIHGEVYRKKIKKSTVTNAYK